MFWPALPLATLGVIDPEPDWATKKALIRDRLHVIHKNANALYSRSDPFPGYTMDRRPDTHGDYDREWDRITIDLESLHDKFWHVYNETLAHEMAHRQAGLLGHPKGHGDEFDSIFRQFLTTQHGLLDP